MNKKILSIVMAIVLLVGIFSGFTFTKAAPANSDKAKLGMPNDYGWRVPYKTLEFSIYFKPQGDPVLLKKNSAMMNKYLLDQFNVKVNEICYNTDPNERFNLSLTSNDYPEVIANITKTDVLKLKEQGKLLDLTPYVNQYGKNIKKELGSLYPRYLDSDKKMYYVPDGWGLLPIPDYSAHLRLDWYKEIGSPKFSTPDEYYAVLKKMIAKHPKNADGKKVYALSWESSYSKIETVAGMWGLKGGYKEDAKHNLTHWINTPEGLAFTKFYNKVYRDGLLDPDAFSNKFQDWKTKFSNQTIAGHIGPWWESWNAGHEVWQKLDKNWKEEQRFVQVSLKDKNAKKAYLSPKDTTGGSYTVITNKCKNPAEVIKFLDMSITPNGNRLMSWGVPNRPESNWNFKKGKWSFAEKAKASIIDSTYDYQLHDLLGGGIVWLIHGQGPMPDAPSANGWIDQCFNDQAKWKKLMNDNLKDTIYDNSAMTQIEFAPEDSITLQRQDINDIIKSSWAKTVLSKTEAEFNKNFADMKSKLNKAGVADLEKFMTEKYKLNLKNWGQK